MSDLFMDMHRRRWHIPQTPPSSSTTSSTQQTQSDRTFTHSNNTDGAACNDNNNQRNAHDEEEEDQEDDVLANVLSLKLRKPKHWKWELTTSKSCANIALPRIILYDHKGKLLVDAQDEDDHVYKQEDFEKPKRDKTKKRPHQHNQQQQQLPHQRSATTNLTHSIRQALEKEFNGLQIHEATPSPEPTLSNRSHRSRKAIELNTTDLPDYELSRRSSSLRGVRFNVEDDEAEAINDRSQIPEFLPTPPSTTTTTTPTSNSSGPGEKRKYRRSHSSGRSPAHSESILERFSYRKGRFSSPEFGEEHQVQHAPRYYLRTSKAGTLLVQEDSLSHYPLRRRRRPHKNQSNESLQSSPKITSAHSSAAQVSANESRATSEVRRRKLQPIRRYLSDGNILLNKQLSTSEEDDVATAAGQKQTMDNVSSRRIRKYSQTRQQSKDLKFSPEVHQNGKVR